VSKSFFTRPILKELSTPIHNDVAETAGITNDLNLLSQGDPTIQSQKLQNKRKSGPKDERNNKRTARQMADLHFTRKGSNLVTIYFQVFKDGHLETLHEETVDSSNPLAVEEAARQYIQKGLRPWSTDLRPLLPGKVFDSATSLGLNTIILLPEGDINIDEPLLKAISRISLINAR
jgi:hypothetical protein